ncbi:N-terminal acetyltransferase [Arachnomyces sp. PD_36]|nr:N-terminal acetyltransferase [Arachnomyces sp. PD_36]
MISPTLSREQLAQYFNRVNNGKDSGEERLKNVEKAIQSDPLEALADLHRAHLAKIMFSNIALHYSPDHSISLAPDVIFHRLVERGLGGYCMETSGLFQIVLRSLGYKVYPTGARISSAVRTGVDDGGYGGWSHMVLIVTLDQGRYMRVDRANAVDVDAGMAALTPIKPLPLIEDGVAATGISPAQIRLRKDNIQTNTNTDSSQRLWIYDKRNNPEDPWTPMYCFSEVEFGRPDFEVMNFDTSQNPRMWFTFKLVCAQMMLNQSGDKIIGQIILETNEVKRRVHGVTEERETLKTESDRIAALKKWFDVHLREEEIEGIRGKQSELPRS